MTPVTMADYLERDYSSDSSDDSVNELLNFKIFSQESTLPAREDLNSNGDGGGDVEFEKNLTVGNADEICDYGDENEEKSPRKITQSDEEPPPSSTTATAAEIARGTTSISRVNVTPPKQPKAKRGNAQSPHLSNDDFLSEDDMESKAKKRAQMPLLPKKVGHPSTLYFRQKIPKKGRNSGFGNNSSGTATKRRRKKPEPLYFPCRVVPSEEVLGLALRAPIDESGDCIEGGGDKVERVVQYVQFPHAFLRGVGQYEVVSMRSLIPFYGEGESAEPGSEKDNAEKKERDDGASGDGRDEMNDDEKSRKDIVACDDTVCTDDGNVVKPMNDEEGADAIEEMKGSIDQKVKNEIEQNYDNKLASEAGAANAASADAAQTNTAAIHVAVTDVSKTNSVATDVSTTSASKTNTAASDAAAAGAAASDVRADYMATTDSAAPTETAITKTAAATIHAAAADVASSDVTATNIATTHAAAMLPPTKSTFPQPLSSSLPSTISATRRTTTPTTLMPPKRKRKKWCPIILEKYFKQLKKNNRNFQPIDLKTEELYLERVLEKSYLEEEETMSKNEVLLNGNQNLDEPESPSDNGNTSKNQTQTQDTVDSSTSATQTDSKSNAAKTFEKSAQRQEKPPSSSSAFSEDEDDRLRSGVKRPRRLCNPYENPSSISHLEPLRPGDIIAFYKPPYGHGNSLGYTEAEILAVDPRAEKDGKDTPILTLDDYMIHLTSEHMVKRIRRRLRGGRTVKNEIGKYRKIGAYVLKKEGNAEKALRERMEGDAERGKEIVERNKRILKEKLEEIGGPCDLIR